MLWYIFLYILLFMCTYNNLHFFCSLWINIDRKIMSKKQKKKKTRQEWIIHYKGFDFYIKVKEISENSEQETWAGKLVLEQLDGANFHQKQCKGIPDIVNWNHCIHMTTRYKKFALILHSQSKEAVVFWKIVNFFRINMALSGDCNFFQKIRIRQKGQIVLPKKNYNF